MKLTVLMENTPGEGLPGEHGLSIHISFEGREYLLDAGASGKFVHNAAGLGVHLDRVDAAVLSHNHFDHSRGFPFFFEMNPKASLYLQETAKEPPYIKFGPFHKYIGMPKSLPSTYASRLCYVKGTREIAPGVWVVCHTAPGLEQVGKACHMYRKTARGLQPDDFGHEQSLVFFGKDGLVVLNSCSHAGVDTVIQEVKAAFPGEPLAAFVGGFHLMGTAGVGTMRLSEEEVAALGRRLLDSGMPAIYTCHCTGHPAFAVLKKGMGETLHKINTGDVLNL